MCLRSLMSFMPFPYRSSHINPWVHFIKSVSSYDRGVLECVVFLHTTFRIYGFQGLLSILLPSLLFPSKMFIYKINQSILLCESVYNMEILLVLCKVLRELKGSVCLFYKLIKLTVLFIWSIGMIKLFLTGFRTQFITFILNVYIFNYSYHRNTNYYCIL